MKNISINESNTYGSALDHINPASPKSKEELDFYLNSESVPDKKKKDIKSLHENYYSLYEIPLENKESPYVQLMDKKIWQNGTKSTAEILDTRWWTKAGKSAPMSPFALPMKLYQSKFARDVWTFPLKIPKLIVNFITNLIQSKDNKPIMESQNPINSTEENKLKELSKETSIKDENEDLNGSKFSQSQAMNDMQDEPDLYSLKDSKEVS